MQLPPTSVVSSDDFPDFFGASGAENLDENVLAGAQAFGGVFQLGGTVQRRWHHQSQYQRLEVTRKFAFQIRRQNLIYIYYHFHQKVNRLA